MLIDKVREPTPEQVTSNALVVKHKTTKLTLKSEHIRSLALRAPAGDATNSSQCNACSCEQHCEQAGKEPR